MPILLKRIYEAPELKDGFRILIDRVWPRGISKERAKLDQWIKELAPSASLRKWFAHDEAKFTQFKARYIEELKHEVDMLKILKVKSKSESVTLLYGAKNKTFNQAVVLKEVIEDLKL